MKYLILIFMLSGCSDLKTQFKCQDGVLYTKEKGVWIQLLYYKNNKCLPDEETGK